MIKKLKRKIVFSMMTILVILLVIAFTAMYIMTARNLSEDSMRAMEMAAEKPNNSFFDRPDKNKHGYFSLITIDLNETDKTFKIDGYSVSYDDMAESDIEYINELINAVKEKDGSNGIIKSDTYNYRYLSVKNRNITRIVLLDKGYENQTLRALMVSQVMIGVLLILSFLFVTTFVAKKAVAPAEKSWEQQKQLVADASHELKTPLTVISANTDIVLSSPDSTVEEQRKWLGYIKAETVRMTELVNNMLFLAKNEDGLGIPVLSCVNLSDISTEMALPFESVCFEKGKQLYVDIKPDLYVKGDSPSLRHLISIFLDNACKYSDENGHIEYCLYSEGEKIEMVIRNSGEPIPKEDIDKIFTRFYRVNKARSRTEGGYGLGLSIAKAILDAHSARVTVTSTPQDGTIFKCVFKKAKV